jgi:hypothetical protein
MRDHKIAKKVKCLYFSGSGSTIFERILIHRNEFTNNFRVKDPDWRYSSHRVNIIQYQKSKKKRPFYRPRIFKFLKKSRTLWTSKKLQEIFYVHKSDFQKEYMCNFEVE